MLDQAFDALKTYDWGTDKNVLNPIEDAVVSTHGDAAARKSLENRLAEVLKSGALRDAKDYACRKLMVVGTAESVPTLAGLLPDKDLSHMARFALERMPAPEATAALRDALGKTQGSLKIGVISSLGVRRDEQSVPALAALLGDGDPAIAAAAACALGDIGSASAGKALAGAKPADAHVRCSVTDASLACAEDLLAAGQKADAVAIYKSLDGEDQPKHVRVAAKRGQVAALAK